MENTKKVHQTIPERSKKDMDNLSLERGIKIAERAITQALKFGYRKDSSQVKRLIQLSGAYDRELTIRDHPPITVSGHGKKRKFFASR